MVYQFRVNQSVQDGSDAVLQWKNFMITPKASGGPGWTLVKSSDGYASPVLPDPSYNYDQDNVTTVAKMKAEGAWFILRAPGSKLEICLQQTQKQNTGSPILNWSKFRIKMSLSGFDLRTNTNGFTQLKVPPAYIRAAQSPAPTPPSSATHGKPDEIVWGSGTDDVPVGIEIFPQDNTYKLHMMADDADGYGFYFFATQIGSPLVTSGVVLDPMLKGSYPTEDVQPYVWYGRLHGYNGTHSFKVDNMVGADVQNAPKAFYQGAFFNYNKSNETFAGVGVAVPCLRHWSNGYLYPMVSRLTSNPHSGKDDIFPVIWMKADPDLWGNNPLVNYGLSGWPNYAFGYKGISSIMKLVSTNRSTLDTLSIASSGDRIVVNDMCLPWNGTTPQL